MRKPEDVPYSSHDMSWRLETHHESTSGGPSACRITETIFRRQHTSPKRLKYPGPTYDELHHFICAAASAPDHGKLKPWRFVLAPLHTRQALSRAFVAAAKDDDPLAPKEQFQRAEEKAYQSPTLLLAIAHLGRAAEKVTHTDVLVSMGCAVQNLLLAATGAGYATSLTSGKTLQSSSIRELFKLSKEEIPVCFINIGTAQVNKPRCSTELPDGLFSVLDGQLA